jgi:hypothetical protein
MHTIDFDTITKPTPAAYDAADPTKQQENFYYRLNQVFDQLSGTMDIDLAEHLSALSVEGTALELPGLKIVRSGRVVSLIMSP